MKKFTVAALAGIAMLASGAAKAEPVVLMTWGGVWQKTFQELAAIYKTKTGKDVTIVAQATGDAGLARLVAQKGKSDVDLWTPNMINYVRALNAQVLEPLDAKALPNAADVQKTLIFSHAITAWVSQRGIFYRKDLVPFEPKEWKDLWDPRL
ncbi:MAG TPA: extracellular solute-binding protein, partial [Xanthobacteraceae bacterium]|nr:extracellular solute-binding protein [Xanthobacteraceae bacterium]